MQHVKFDPEDRLVDFTCSVIIITEALPVSRTGTYYADCLMKSAYNIAWLYSNSMALAAITARIAGLTTVLQNLRVCSIIIKIIGKKSLVRAGLSVERLLKESQELQSIINKEISSAKKRKR